MAIKSNTGLKKKRQKKVRLMNDLCVCIKYIFKGKVLEALESDIAIVGSQHESLKHIIADQPHFLFFFLQEHQNNKPSYMVNVEYLKFRKPFEKLSQKTLVDKLEKKKKIHLLRSVQDQMHKCHMITIGANQRFLKITIFILCYQKLYLLLI